MRFFLIRSTDFGGTWSAPEELLSCDQTSYKDMEAYGDIFHLVWSGRFEERMVWETYYIRSTDRGLSWSDPELLTPFDSSGSQMPTLSINGQGELAVVWYDGRYSPPGWTGDIFLRKSLDQGQNWARETQITFTHLDAFPDVFYEGDTIHVVFERGYTLSRSVVYIKSTDGGLTWGPETDLDQDSGDSYWPRVAAASGYTYVVWADDRDNPDTTGYGGLYFSKYPDEPNDVADGGAPSDGNSSLKCYPNPFNNVVSISYSFQDEKGGELEIFNIQGQRVRSISLDGKEGKIEWDARDALGNKVSSGIYFAKALAPHSNHTIKLLYLR
jgi:hypothetical protein